MALNIVDVGIILFLILGAIVGFKNGAIKEGTKFIGFFAIVLISFLLKDRLMVLLYENMPFFKFFGFIRGLDTINILLYQLIAFLIIFIALIFVLRVIIVITGLIEWLLKMTVFLSIPSKFIGIIVGIIEYYIYIFIAVYVLSMPIFNLSFVEESKLAGDILMKTPILSGLIDNTVEVYQETWDIIKSKNDDNINEINKLVLINLLDNNLITIESAKELVRSNKIIVDDRSFLDNYTSDGDLYEKLKEAYYKDRTIIEFPITTKNQTETIDNISIKVNSLSDYDCSINATCKDYNLIKADLTINVDSQIIQCEIFTNGKYNKLENVDMYIYAKIKDGKVVIGLAN